jgi:hypothetical protein
LFRFTKHFTIAIEIDFYIDHVETCITNRSYINMFTNSNHTKKYIAKYIDSKPLYLRIKVLSKSRFLGFHPIDIYKFRPSKIGYMIFYEYFEKFDLIKMVHPSFQQYGKDALSFIIYKNEKLVRRFINFHPIHNNEGFLKMCYYRRYLL